MTLVNVELVKVGTWAASTGVTKITADDLTAMAAAYADQLVDRPPIKLGHDDDNVFNAALGDGEPAYGWLENVAVGDGSEARPNKDALYGDVVGMPSKLEAVAPTAYRRRSVEIAWGVKAASGKAYRAVLTGLALLGVKPPAVKGLADVLALYSDVTDATGITAVEIVDGIDDPTQVAAFSEAVAALAALSALDTSDLPPRSGASGHGDTEAPAAPSAAKIEKEPVVADKKTFKKSDLDALLEKARDKAADDDVTDLVTAALGGAEAPAGEPAGEQAPVATAASAQEPKADEPETVTLTKETFDKLSAGAAAGVTAATEIAKQRRESVLDKAIREGRISPAERETFAAQLEKDEEVTTTLLSALAPRYATAEVGTDLPAPSGSQLSEGDQKAWDEFANSTFGTSFGAEK